MGMPGALIVDDEAPARLRLRELLARTPSFVLCGECASAAEAIAAIRDVKPDLVLLDVQMPGMDGFHVLREITGDQMPAVIFVTAYDRYALAAFEAHALDYVLKPFSDERFARALDRAVAQIEMRHSGELAKRICAMLDERADMRHGAEVTHGSGRLMVRVSGRVVVLKVAEIDWVEAAGVYAEVHVGKATYLHRESLTSLETRLAPGRFVRIHRSRLVNLDRVRELATSTRGEPCVRLSDGTALKLSRGYRQRLEEMLTR